MRRPARPVKRKIKHVLSDWLDMGIDVLAGIASFVIEALLGEW